MDDFTKEVVLTALKDMFQSSSYSICTVDKCLKLTRSIPGGDYNALSALHCVKYQDMSPGLRKSVFEKTIAMLSLEGFDLTALEMEFDQNQGCWQTPKKRRFKLLGA